MTTSIRVSVLAGVLAAPGLAQALDVPDPGPMHIVIDDSAATLCYSFPPERAAARPCEPPSTVDEDLLASYRANNWTPIALARLSRDGPLADLIVIERRAPVSLEGDLGQLQAGFLEAYTASNPDPKAAVKARRRKSADLTVVDFHLTVPRTRVSMHSVTVSDPTHARQYIFLTSRGREAEVDEISDQVSVALIAPPPASPSSSSYVAHPSESASPFSPAAPRSEPAPSPQRQVSVPYVVGRLLGVSLVGLMAFLIHRWITRIRADRADIAALSNPNADRASVSVDRKRKRRRPPKSD